VLLLVIAGLTPAPPPTRCGERPSRSRCSPRSSSGWPAGSRSSLSTSSSGSGPADRGVRRVGGRRRDRRRRAPCHGEPGLSAALGLALTASLWWAFFGTADDDRAARSLAYADRADRPRLVLVAYFYAYIPILLGIVAMAVDAAAGIALLTAMVAAALIAEQAGEQATVET